MPPKLAAPDVAPDAGPIQYLKSKAQPHSSVWEKTELGEGTAGASQVDNALQAVDDQTS